MSATLPNLDLLANWLQADLYKTDYRPIPLTEYIKVGRRIYNSQLEFVKNLTPSVKLQASQKLTSVPYCFVARTRLSGECDELFCLSQDDIDDMVYLCLETLLNGHSVLVFCPTKVRTATAA
jgi:DNA polymerase theta